MLRLICVISVVGGLAFGQPVLSLKNRVAVAARQDVKSEPFRKRMAESVTARKWSVDRSHWIVQFAEPVTAAQMDALRAMGAEVLGYVPDQALLVRARDEQDWSALALYRVEHLRAEDKVSVALDGLAEESMTLVIEFHPGVDAGAAREIATREGLLLRNNADLLETHLLAEGTLEQVWRVAAWDEVAYVFPASPELVQGTPVRACAGALTTGGHVGNLAVKVGEGWDGAGKGSSSLSYSIDGYTEKVAADQVRSEIARALGEWSRHIQLSFTEGGGSDSARHISFLFARGSHGDNYAFDGKGSVLAHTFYPAPPNPEPIAGDLHFDEDEDWKVGNDTDLYSVTLHELGHALGLGHSDLPSAVMYAYYRRDTVLTPDDIQSIRELYAAREQSTETPGGGPLEPPTGPPESPSTPAAPTTPTTSPEGPIEPPLPPPSAPTTPTVPATPTVPTTPTVPATPTVPTTPTVPATPTVPTTPTVPIEPTTPTLPTLPTAPTPPPTPPPAPAPPTTPTPPVSPSGDRTPPSLRLLNPLSTSVVTTADSITLRGTAADSSGITRVVWTSNAAGSGDASGTTSWTATVALYRGANYLVVRAYDAAGNSAWRSLVVTRR